ncbi:MAG: cation-translocating P-type ATPase, partial [Clostridia bacterium]|nr:cation-translocating P-type ATPase [Clostridia bacterium]
NKQVVANRSKYGINEIDKEKRKSLLVRFLLQFKNIMVLILLASAIISITVAIINNQTGELFEGFVILFIVIMNSIVGVIQENKAEACINELRKSEKTTAKAFRDGVMQIVPTQDLVVGDIVCIEAGDIVPADMRLMESNNLKCDESKLTGESMSSTKDANYICSSHTTLAERVNMAYSGSLVTNGKAKGIVVSVGNNTEIGKIAHLLFNSNKDTTPLQKSIEKIGKFITWSVLAICVVIFLIELIFVKDSNFIGALMVSVALAVAAIPESLPAVITLIMAMGVQQLAKRKVIIKQLSAVETLGSCEIICTDKTGTLTQNKMTVVQNFTNNDYHIQITNINPQMLNCMRYCNNSYIDANQKVVGEPTENAIFEYSLKLNIKPSKRIQEIAFDSTRKMMTTLNVMDGEIYSYTKGAFDRVIKLCSYIDINGNIVPLTDNMRAKLTEVNNEMANKALRVLGFCYKRYDSFEGTEDLENDMIFVGLTGMMDTPRKEVAGAIKKCFKAGLKPVMITGDHKQTAFAIARDLGIAKSIDQVLTGDEIEKMSDKEFADKVQQYTVFARVSPEHKVKIVKAYKSLKKIVAMTGDGVNDAPSLKIADIGVGMGISGTDIVKSVSDMLITDDNFASIVVAVEEGRKVYNNIQKALQYLISTNCVEVFGMLFGLVFFPQYSFLLPSQMLFINLVSDSLPAFALGKERVEPEIMSMPPRKSSSGLFGQDVGVSIIYQSILQMGIVIGVYLYALFNFGSSVATTMTFFTIVFMQLLHSVNCKTNQSILGKNLLDNPTFNFCFVLSFGISILVAVCPIFYTLFKLEFLNVHQWIMVAIASFSIIPLCEVVKLFLNYRKKSNYHFGHKNIKIEENN